LWTVQAIPALLPMGGRCSLANMIGRKLLSRACSNRCAGLRLDFQSLERKAKKAFTSLAENHARYVMLIAREPMEDF